MGGGAPVCVGGGGPPGGGGPRYWLPVVGGGLLYAFGCWLYWVGGAKSLPVGGGGPPVNGTDISWWNIIYRLYRNYKYHNHIIQLQKLKPKTILYHFHNQQCNWIKIDFSLGNKFWSIYIITLDSLFVFFQNNHPLVTKISSTRR